MSFRSAVGRAWAAGAALVTATWVALATVAPARLTPVGGAAAAAAAAVVAVAWRPGPRWGGSAHGALAAPVALFGYPAAVAWAASGESGIPLATALAVASIGTASRHHRPELRLAAIAIVGTVALTTSLLSSHAGRPGWGLDPSGEVQALALLGAAVACFAAGSVRRVRGGPVRLEPLAPAGAVLGLAAAPIPPEAGVVVAAVAVAASLTGRPVALVIGTAGMAVATVPGGRPPALLLLAAAVLAVALPRAIADVPALPGVVALAGVVLSAPLDARDLGVAALASAALSVVALRPRAPLPSWPPHPAVGPALLLGAWLAVAPSSWGFVDADIQRYDWGAATAAAIGGLAAVSAAARGVARSGPTR